MAKACALMTPTTYLDGFLPFIRASAEERDGAKQNRETRSTVHFGCRWDVVMMWEEPDLEVVSRRPKVERELFVNFATGINFDKYDSVVVNIEGDNIPPPLASVSHHLFFSFLSSFLFLFFLLLRFLTRSPCSNLFAVRRGATLPAAEGQHHPERVLQTHPHSEARHSHCLAAEGPDGVRANRIWKDGGFPDSLSSRHHDPRIQGLREQYHLSPHPNSPPHARARHPGQTGGGKGESLSFLSFSLFLSVYLFPHLTPLFCS